MRVCLSLLLTATVMVGVACAAMAFVGSAIGYRRPLGPAIVETAVAIAGEARNDAEKIQGTWLVVSAQALGKPISDEEIKSARFVFTKDRIAMDGVGKEKEELGYALDATKKPKWIDITERDKTFLGIYELDGDTLKICFNKKDGGERATKFASEKDSPNEVLVVLKREKK